jgi:hypothetical protein
MNDTCKWCECQPSLSSCPTQAPKEQKFARYREYEEGEQAALEGRIPSPHWSETTYRGYQVRLRSIQRDRELLSQLRKQIPA